MMYDQLINTYLHFTALNNDEKQKLREIFVPLHLKKGCYFLRSGELSRYVGFLNKGLVCYYVMKNDDMAITDFSKEGEFVSEYHTFISKSPAMHSIKCIEDCEFLVANYDGIQYLYNEFENGNKFGRSILEHRFGIVVNQLISLYMHSPKERYQKFTEYFYDLSQRIPQYLVATFIGVKPQSLSRIRKRAAELS